MPNRDTYDIDEAERLDSEEQTQKESINIQPQTLIDAMADSEPSLFSNSAEIATQPKEVNPLVYYRIARYQEIARWHADLQVKWWQEFWTGAVS